MCDASKLAPDWVTKGCHIHVDGIELAIFSNHLGGVDFRPVFSGESARDVVTAIRTAIEKCLPDPEVRKLWIRQLNAARVYMVSYIGEPASLANGRMFEFKMIRIAIERWGTVNGNT